MNYKSSSELKALAREQLKGKYGVPIGAVVITMMLSVVVTIMASFFDKTDSLTSIVIYYLITCIISLLSAVLSMGLIKFFMNFCRKQNYQIGNIFWGFINHPDKVIVSTILLTIILLVVLVPGSILIVVYVVTQSILLFAVAILALIVGIVLMIVLGLSYSQVYYLIADESQESAVEALRASRKMMQGNKVRLFYLKISFIGWFILSILSCGIALLWIEPYMMCTTTYFYMDLKGEFKVNVIDELI